MARHRSRKFDADLPTLLETATHVDPEGYRTIAAHWKLLADDLLAPDERDERNVLDLAESYGGSWVLRGVFDEVRGAALQRMLLERSAPTGADDLRSASERRADAFFELLTGGLPVQARLDVIVDVDTFVGGARPIEDIRCELAGQGAIERVVMERLACNAHVGRVLARGKHEVLELGRQVRLATPAQRRSVIARDQGCIWPHCKRPPSMCEVHHIVPWQHGGESNVDNLALLCGIHHTHVHKGWNLQRYQDGTWDAVPP
jgi:5-methylcytosine-specific restriction endonuclease McrA